MNPFIRKDSVHYYGSRNPFDDIGATLGQNRALLNYGIKGDLSYVHGPQTFKAGLQIMQTRLQEQFSLGVTDPGFNAVCVDADGNPQALPTVTNPDNCGAAGFVANPDVQVGLIPFDLTRGGRLFDFASRGKINQYAFYGVDTITYGGLTVNAGLRIDQYNGLAAATGVQPRIAAAYLDQTNRYRDPRGLRQNF